MADPQKRHSVVHPSGSFIDDQVFRRPAPPYLFLSYFRYRQSDPLASIYTRPAVSSCTSYNVLVVTLGNYLLVRKWRFASSLYRWQTSVILSAALVLYLMYGFYLSGITPLSSLKDLDINPFIYSLWGLAIGIAIFKYRLFDLAPIARETLIEMLSNGVVVVDAHTRIVDANPEAQRMFGWEKPPVG